MSESEILLRWVLHHQVAITIAAAWIITCAVQSLPKPQPNSAPFYTWMFTFSHLATGAIPRLIALVGPQKYAAMFNSTLQPTENGASTPPANGSSKTS